MNPAARELIADAKRRARLIRSARTEEMRRALAHRICFDLVMALRAGRTADFHHSKERTRWQ